MLKICNFIFKESERNGRVLVLFSYKEAHKTTRRTEKVKFYRVANKEKGGNQSLRGRKGSQGTVQKQTRMQGERQAETEREASRST